MTTKTVDKLPTIQIGSTFEVNNVTYFITNIIQSSDKDKGIICFDLYVEVLYDGDTN